MIVQDQLDSSLRWIGSIEDLEKFDEFSASVAILNHRVDLASHKVNAGQQAERAMSLIFVLPGKSCIDAGLGGQVCGGSRDGLDPWLLVIRDDCYVLLLLRTSPLLLQQFDSAIDTQHLSHLSLKIRVATLQVISHFVRLYIVLPQDL